jgi:hypothetical protein
MNVGGVINDQSLSDIQTIWRNGQAVKMITKARAGNTYQNPVHRLLLVM